MTIWQHLMREFIFLHTLESLLKASNLTILLNFVPEYALFQKHRSAHTMIHWYIL